jgi:hypothetical protein
MNTVTVEFPQARRSRGTHASYVVRTRDHDSAEIGRQVIALDRLPEVGEVPLSNSTVTWTHDHAGRFRQVCREAQARGELRRGETVH